MFIWYVSFLRLMAAPTTTKTLVTAAIVHLHVAQWGSNEIYWPRFRSCWLPVYVLYTREGMVNSGLGLAPSFHGFLPWWTQWWLPLAPLSSVSFHHKAGFHHIIETVRCIKHKNLHKIHVNKPWTGIPAGQIWSIVWMRDKKYFMLNFLLFLF